MELLCIEKEKSIKKETVGRKIYDSAMMAWVATDQC